MIGRAAFPKVSDYLTTAQSFNIPYLSALKVSYIQREIAQKAEFTETVTAFKAATGRSTFLPFDVYNRISTDLISTCDFLQGNGGLLECKFPNDFRLCVDLEVSKVLEAQSLSDVFPIAGLQSVSEEFVIAIMWDQSPDFSNIASVLAKLTAGFRLPAQNGKVKGYVHRLILSKGVLSALVIPDIEGRVKVAAGGAVLGMTWQEMGKMAVEWELRPDLAFCTTSGTGLLPSNGNWSETVTAMTTISLQEDLPYAEIEEALPGAEIDVGKRCQEIHEGKFSPKMYEGKLNSEIYEGKLSPEKSSSDDSMKGTPISAGKSPSSLLLTPSICPTCGRDLIGNSCVFCFSPSRAGKNFGTREPVPKSPEKKVYEEISTRWTCSCGKVNSSISNSACLKCYKKKPQAVSTVPEPKMWKCPECDSMNPSDVALCSVCSRREKAGAYWTCAKCNNANAPTFKYCKKCGEDRRPMTAPNPQNESASKQQGPTPSKVAWTTQTELWTCSKCGQSNSKSREICLKCRKSKETMAVTPVPSRNICLKCGNELNGTSECLSCAVSPNPGQKPSPWKPSEEQKQPIKVKWTCQNCGEIDNYSNEATCYRCSKPRIPPQSSTWNCDNCKAVNMAGDSICMLCKLRRGPKPTLELVYNSEDKWRCTSCYRENAMKLQNCSGCGMLSEQKNPVPRNTPNSYDPRGIQEPWKPKRYCTCGVRLQDSEINCGACEAKVISFGKREGKMWKCLNCGRDNISEKDRCQSCYRRKPESAFPTESSPKCLKCGRFVVQGESLCSLCRHRQFQLTQTTKWKCSHCSASNSPTNPRCLKCGWMRS